jgi:hypothetical protein
MWRIGDAFWIPNFFFVILKLEVLEFAPILSFFNHRIYMCKVVMVFFLFASSVSSCVKDSANNAPTRDTPYQENRFIRESKYRYGSEPLSDLAYRNYNPAQKDQIQKVNECTYLFQIEYGYSFGECLGFCERKIKFTSAGVLTTSVQREDNLTICTYEPMDQKLYDSLTNSFDFKEFKLFDDYLGCGDCADGGTEYLRISKNSKETKVISGTYGFEVACVQKLLDYFRQN